MESFRTVTLGAASKCSGCLRKEALRGPGEENTSSIAYKKKRGKKLELVNDKASILK